MAMTQTTTANTPTWYDQLSNQFGNTISGALSNVSNLGNNWYNQPTVAGLDPLQQAGLSMAEGASGQWRPQMQNAGQTLGTAVSQAQGASNYDPNMVNQLMNPYLTGAQQATINESNRNLFQNVLPQVNSTFTGAGQFGSTRNADFTNRAIQNQQSTLTDALAKANYGALDAAQKNALSWGQLGTQGAQVLGGLGQYQTALGQNQAQQSWQDVQNTLGAGEVGQKNQQAGLDAAYKDWLARLSVPMEMFKGLASMVPPTTQLYQQNQTVTGTPISGQSSSSNDLLAILMAGAGIGK